MYTCIRSVKISWAYAMHKGLPHFILKTSIPSRGFCFPSSLFLFQTYLTRFARESLFPSSSRFPTRSTMLARARYRRIEQHNIYERCALCQLVTHTAEKEWSKKSPGTVLSIRTHFLSLYNAAPRLVFEKILCTWLRQRWNSTHIEAVKNRASPFASRIVPVFACECQATTKIERQAEESDLNSDVTKIQRFSFLKQNQGKEESRIEASKDKR